MYLSNHRVAIVCSLIFASLAPFSVAQEAEDGYRPIFNGRDLTGWHCDADLWSVEEGEIIGRTTEPLDRNEFLVWQQGEVDDFELKLRFKISGDETANSGIQFRCQQNKTGHCIGYQADIDRKGQWMGSLYDELSARKSLAKRGQAVSINKSGKRTIREIGTASELWNKINLDEWNDYHILAADSEIRISINGHLMAELHDHQMSEFDRSGKLALQIHSGTPMEIRFKDIHLKRLPLASNSKKIVFIAGKKSHGWGAHEHRAGSLLLAKRLNEAAEGDSRLPVLATVYQDGWPADPTALDNADAVVVYCDGGERHYLHKHGQAFEDIVRRGVGLVCIHYGVEVPIGMSGQRFLNWIGGYFETNWSVNPHWTAKFNSLPDHPITNGVQPFEINDEWYYHMRFSPEMTRVTPILTALPPAKTLKRPDNPHHNNPHVRKSVLERKEPQHVAWAFVRGDGLGRGFGFTGGHWHRNWKNNNFRKLVLNAIAWTAHINIPDNGIESATPTDEEMDANQDYPKPKEE